MKLLSALFLAIAMTGVAQSPEPQVLAANAQIDAGIVNKDIPALKKLYADDFVFTHGTGLVDSKTSWLNNVQRTDVQFKSRVQDSTQVEMHGNVGIVFGRLDIVREQKQQTVRYGIWYVRVFVRKSGRWQCISHRTTKEWHE